MECWTATDWTLDTRVGAGCEFWTCTSTLIPLPKTVQKPFERRGKSVVGLATLHRKTRNLLEKKQISLPDLRYEWEELWSMVYKGGIYTF